MKTLALTLICAAIILKVTIAYSQSIDGGGLHSTAVCNDSEVMAWGNGIDGQLGNRNYSVSNIPVQVSELTSVTASEGGGLHSLALKNDGTV
ncbi:MAG: hypothetical protein LH473_06675 [Chitinophagales bacterium]|nr:hypothetical protein [Chitinophagales bacterium]